jgi:hypothetical protein
LSLILAELLDKLFESYQLLNEHYYRGEHRPCCHECGRFAETSLRMLQGVTTGNYLPLGNPLPKFCNEVKSLENADAKKYPQPIRIQIPRTLQVIYDVRNKRDVGHVGGDVDANFTDATLSLMCCNWVLTEFIRIYYTSDITTAQNIVNSIVKIKIPLIQDFNGFLKILKPNLKLPNKILAFLCYCGTDGATLLELNEWLKNRIAPKHMSITLNRLEHEKAYIHRQNERCYITDTGRRFVEEHIPFQI